MIDNGVPTIFKRRERRLLEEIMNVSHVASEVGNGPCTQNGLRRQIQRNVKYLERSKRLQFLYERNVILDMLDDIDGKNDVEVQVILHQEVLQVELRISRLLPRGPVECCWRYLIARQIGAGKRLPQAQQDVAGSTSDLAYTLAWQVVALDHSLDMISLPRRVLFMPCWIFLRVEV